MENSGFSSLQKRY